MVSHWRRHTYTQSKKSGHLRAMDKLMAVIKKVQELKEAPPKPWTPARIATTVATTAAVGGGVVGAYFVLAKASAAPPSAPSSVGRLLPPDLAAALDGALELREVCEHMARFGGFCPPAFKEVVAAAANVAAFYDDLNTGRAAYTLATPRLLLQLTAAVGRALTEFQRHVPHAARADYMEVDNAMDTALGNIQHNVSLESKARHDTAALQRGMGMSRSY